ncbi:acyl-CoA dehydrogenase family protein [Streptomyces sp. B3I8]|uniref:acyl-CoA dehydrogenase family protein n=1 Tax=Streptomyces sp. B3I8 TaxID=3042303 RepID=UPI0027D7DCE9|nr:acyl-CoA dehydrogenase family protein [Streptomyces sp. B3I8]
MAERIRLQARDAAVDNEAARRLVPELTDALRDSGLMRCGVPATLGGAQAPPAVSLAAAENIARGDAATGWCVMIAFTSSLLAAHLPPAGATELLSDPRSVTAGVWAPRAVAHPVDGGLVISGRWSFASGITHADSFFGGCLLEGAQEGGEPEMRLVGMPTTQLQMLDTWHTVGLRGTGSQDVVAEEIFVPSRRVISLTESPVVDAPLYRFPIFGYFALAVAAVALGNARGAIEDLLDLASRKTVVGSRRTLAGRPATQIAVAQAEAELRAARALFYSAIDEAWRATKSGGIVSADLRVGLRLAATHAARTSAEVVRIMHDLGGGTAIYDDSPLQRRSRDATTITAHAQVSPTLWETTGRMLLGVPTDVERHRL